MLALEMDEIETLMSAQSDQSSLLALTILRRVKEGRPSPLFWRDVMHRWDKSDLKEKGYTDDQLKEMSKVSVSMAARGKQMGAPGEAVSET